MDQLEAFALPAEDYGMVADRVARPEAHHRYLLMRPYAGDPLTAENRIAGKVRIARLRYNPPERQRGSAGGVNLGPVMYLDHFSVEALENLRHLGGDLHQHVDADAHVGCDYRARARGKFLRPRFQCRCEAG